MKKHMISAVVLMITLADVWEAVRGAWYQFGFGWG